MAVTKRFKLLPKPSLVPAQFCGPDTRSWVQRGVWGVGRADASRGLCGHAGHGCLGPWLPPAMKRCRKAAKRP